LLFEILKFLVEITKKVVRNFKEMTHIFRGKKLFPSCAVVNFP